jgi:hypothetical protein
MRSSRSGEPQNSYPLHPDLGIVAEPGRCVVRHHRTPSHPPRRVSSVRDVMINDPDLHQRMERPLPTLRLDQNRRPDPDKANRKTTSVAVHQHSERSTELPADNVLGKGQRAVT